MDLEKLLRIGKREHQIDLHSNAGLFDEDNELNQEAFQLALRMINEKRTNEQKNQLFDADSPNLAVNDPFPAITITCHALKKGIIGIFGPRSLNNIHAVQSVCYEKAIPHILTRWMHKPLSAGITANFYPYAPLLTQAYLDIITGWNWKTFTVLYEDDESLLRLLELIVVSKEKGIVVTIEQLDRDNTENYRDALKKIEESNQKFIVIDCNINILEEVLKQCQQVGIMTRKHNYFITNLDTHTTDLTSLQWSKANITGIRLINPESRYVQDISKLLFPEANEEYEEIGSKVGTETALLIDAVYMFSDIFSKMEKNKLEVDSLDCEKNNTWNDGFNLVNLLTTSTHEGLTGPIAFNTTGHRIGFRLQVYELREGGITNVATWNPSEGLNVTRIYHAAQKLEKDSMRNKTFTIIISLTDPYGMLRETPENLVGNERYEGFSIDLIHELSLLEGFNYEFIVQADGKNGKLENGRWTGMIGAVIDGVADMAITDLTITSDRAEAVDFTTPFMNLGISILFQKPSRAPSSFFSFAKPFAMDIWIALAVAFIVVSLSFFILGRLCREWVNPYPCVKEPEFLTNQFGLTNSIWFATGAMFQQGSKIIPMAIPTRLVAVVWWFFVFIMVSCYMARLWEISFLRRTENFVGLFTNVQSLVQNANMYGIRYGAKAGGATMNFFEKSENPLYRQMAKHMRDHPEDMPNSNEGGVIMAESDKYAFLMESTTVEYTIQRHCILTVVGDRLDEKGYGIALRKGSPYRAQLSIAILKLQSSGVIEKIKNKWWEEKRGGGQCKDYVANIKPVDLEDVKAVFYITILGTILGAVLVLFEFTFSIVRTARKTKMSCTEVLAQELKLFFKFSTNVKPVLECIADDEEKSHSKSEGANPTPNQRSKSRKSKPRDHE